MRFPTKVATLVLALLCVLAPAAFAQVGENYSWTVYSALNSARDVAFDAEGAFWVATTGGVVAYSSPADSFRIYHTTEGLLALNTSAVDVDPATGDVYAGSSNGFISIIRGSGSWGYATEIAKMTDRPSRTITGFGFHEGRVYVLTGFGVGVYNPDDSIFIESYFRFGPVPQNTPVNAIAFWNGRIWLGTDKGLVHAPLDGSNLAAPSSWSQYVLDAADSVSALVGMGDSLFVGTRAGGYTIGAEGFRKRDDLPNTTIFLASSGVHLAAAAGNTVFRYQDGSFRNLADAIAPLTSVAVATDGTIGAGLQNRGFAILQGNTLAVKTPNAPGGNLFNDLTIATDGALWTAHAQYGGVPADGLSRFRNGSWQRFAEGNPPQLRSGGVWQVGAGQNGSVWAGTYGRAATHFIPNDTGVSATLYNAGNSAFMGGDAGDPGFIIVGKGVTDANGRTWFTNYDNRSSLGPILVVKLRPGEESSDGSGFEAFDDDNNRTRVFSTIAIDDNGTKWLASPEPISNSQGLYAFNDRGTLNDKGDDIWKSILSGEGGLPTNKPTAVAVDRLGEVWVGTEKGISVLINPSSFVFSENTRPVFRTIRALGDIPVRSITVDALNRKWVGTNQGVFLLSPEGDSVRQRFTEENSPLVSNDVRSILAVDATGDIYIGTANGLNRLTTAAVRPPETVETLSVSPQPFILPSAEPLRISGLPANAVIKIFGPRWGLVRQFPSPGGAVALWDGLDDLGNPVPSGVYIIAAGSDSGEDAVVGKVAVIRR